VRETDNTHPDKTMVILVPEGWCAADLEEPHRDGKEVV
jgi:hypothetical protein